MRRAAVLAAVTVLMVGVPAFADDGDQVLGTWATDPEGEDGQAHIEIYKQGDVYHGKIVWLSEPVYPADDEEGMAGQTKIDRENPKPELRQRPVMGLEMMSGFVYKGDDQWGKGTIYAPDNGKTYKCKMKLEGDDVLKVRGFIGFSLLGRTEEWTRVIDEPEASTEASAEASD